MKDIILASASPRRSELLKQIGVSFRVFPSNVDEDMDCGCSPAELVQKLAYEKALNVAAQVGKGFSPGEGPLVIGADTVVVKDGILGKPADERQAYDMIKLLQGEWHEVITGVAVVDVAGSKSTTGFETTRVKMRRLTDEMIHSYIKTREPMDKAGAYGIQGLGALLVEKIEGCYFNVVGLPLTRLSIMLEEFKVKLL